MAATTDNIDCTVNVSPSKKEKSMDVQIIHEENGKQDVCTKNGKVSSPEKTSPQKLQPPVNGKNGTTNDAKNDEAKPAAEQDETEPANKEDNCTVVMTPNDGDHPLSPSPPAKYSPTDISPAKTSPQVSPLKKRTDSSNEDNEGPELKKVRRSEDGTNAKEIGSEVAADKTKEESNGAVAETVE